VDAVRVRHLLILLTSDDAGTTPSVEVRRRSATMCLVPPTDRQIDELDRQLLVLLAADGRLTMADLGRRIGLSRTAVLARVQRLERAGVIRGYRAEIELPGAAAAHRARVGIVIRTPDVAGYVRRLAALRGFDDIETVTGEYDLIVQLAAPTAAELDAVLDQVQGWRETVRTTTWMILRRYRTEA
jgi:Lrp/AsnC family transcriptional regulator, leucine-responsive regulatory protein